MIKEKLYCGIALFQKWSFRKISLHTPFQLLLIWEAIEREAGPQPENKSKLSQNEKHLHFDTWADAQHYLTERAKKQA